MNAKEISEGYNKRKSLLWLIQRIDDGKDAIRDFPQVDILQQAGAHGLSHIDRVQLNRIAFEGLRCALEATCV